MASSPGAESALPRAARGGRRPAAGAGPRRRRPRGRRPPRARAGAADRAAFGRAQEPLLAPRPEPEQRRLRERGPCREVLDRGGPRVLVPGADELAVVAADDAVADGPAEFERDRSLVLDRQVRDAAPCVEAVRRDDGLRRADVDA